MLTVRAAEPADQGRVARALMASWGGTVVVGHGVAYDAGELPTLLAERGDELVGLLTYTLSPESGLEIVTINALVPRSGAGTALLAATAEVARAAGAARVWLVTTNDNLDALRFYQRRGFRIVGVAPGAVDASRLLKPAIPLVGDYGIELHDELTLEQRL